MVNPKNIFTQKIKDAIVEMVYLEESLPTTKISAYLSNKLDKSYCQIANVFSETTFTSIQNFTILHRIERAKQEIIEGKFSLTEIAYRLSFSSVAHLSNEFKKITGVGLIVNTSFNVRGEPIVCNAEDAYRFS